MELEVLRHQMTTLYEAMAAQTAMANAADVFCVLGQLGSGIQNNDMRNAASAMRHAQQTSRPHQVEQHKAAMQRVEARQVKEQDHKQERSNGHDRDQGLQRSQAPA